MSYKKFIVFSAIVIALAGVATGCSKEPQSLDEALNMGASALEQKDYARAGKMANAALSFRENDTSALIIKALSAEALGDRAQAMDSARQATKADPSSFVAFYTLGRLFAQNDKSLPEAQNALSRALELRPSDEDTLTLLAELYLRIRSGANALLCMDELSKIRPETAKSVAFLNSYAVGCFFAGQTSKGVEKLGEAWREDKNNPDTALNIAIYQERYREPANYRAAISAYKKFISLAKDNPKYSAKIAEIEKHLTTISDK